MCIDNRQTVPAKEVSGAVMILTVIFNKANCEISILSLSLFA